jgi:molybdenum cofactor cytidylyltransferase
VVHALERLLAARDAGVVATVTAVVPDLTTPVATLLAGPGVVIVAAPDAALGLAHSLRAGLAAIAALADGPAAALVALGDQPSTSVAVIERLVQRWRATGAPAVRPRYADDPDAPGHPVLLDRAAWSLAARLEGDRGLGAALRELAGGVALVDVAGANPDIDTRADLAAHHPPENDRCD